MNEKTVDKVRDLFHHHNVSKTVIATALELSVDEVQDIICPPGPRGYDEHANFDGPAGEQRQSGFGFEETDDAR